MPFEQHFRQYSNLSQHIKEPQNGICCWNFLKKIHILKCKTLFHTRSNLQSCLLLRCDFSLCSVMCFSLRENMMLRNGLSDITTVTEGGGGGVNYTRLFRLIIFC